MRTRTTDEMMLGFGGRSARAFGALLETALRASHRFSVEVAAG